ncbi:MAG: c-type cytochrome domain-containing protein, partial [Verrucomicrobiota bacterium]
MKRANIILVLGLCGLAFNATALAAVAQGAPALSPEQLAFFESKIRPVLADKCYSCHSAEAEKVKGGLLLDTREAWMRGGDSGPAIVPGEPDKSRLILAVRYTDEDLQMPPKQKLSEP